MHFVIHYAGEIGSKGQNRNFFSKKLKDNIRSAFRREDYDSIKSENSRIIITVNKNAEKITEKIQMIAGIGFFGIADFAKNNITDIKSVVEKNHPGKYNIKIFLSNKQSGIVFQELKDSLSNHYDIHSPELNIEILDSGAYVYDKKIDGMGGLPVGCTGKLISLLSGGIDSPVASWKMYRRGCSVSFVHFYNPTTNKASVKQKIFDLVQILSKYQFKTKLFIVKFDDVQRQIIASVPADVRMIVYRRFMFRIAQKIAESEKALGFVTGDSLSQVASQTLENIGVIYEAAKIPVFAPLIGEDKDAIIALAKKIGTYSTSIQPYDDCCSFFVAEHPKTKSTIAEILAVEKKMDVKALVNMALVDVEVKTIVG
ncbi:MAG: tRNA uracil 4-sulfurtransferase ThiI [archaeon]